MANKGVNTTQQSGGIVRTDYFIQSARIWNGVREKGKIVFDIQMLSPEQKQVLFLLCAPKDTHVPRHGDTLTIYTRPAQTGDTAIQVELNGKEVFAFTDKDLKEANMSSVITEKDVEQYKQELQETYEQLPKEFQERIDVFQQNNPDFHWKYLSSELFCCTEAVLIVKRFEHENDPLGRIQLFQNETLENKKLLLPTLNYTLHDTNSIGCACFLACVYLITPERVKYAHGVYCPIIGCKQYGCSSSIRFQGS